MKLQNVLRLTMILAVYALTAGSARADLKTGLAGYWQFNGNGMDCSGNGRDLAFSGGSFGAGLLGQALYLPKDNNQYAYRPVSDPAFDFGSSDFTVQVWVNYVSTQDEQVLIEKFTGGGGPGWTFTKVFYPDIDQSVYDVTLSNEMYLNSDAITITTGAWHHLVARRSGETLELFYDNQSIASLTLGAFSIPPSENGLIIGRRNFDDPRGFPMDGALDEIAIWNRALSDAEIHTLYNGGSGYDLCTALPRNISGRITLQGGVDQAQPLTFEFRPTEGSAVFTRTLTLNPDRTYTLTDIPAGNYHVWIKGAKWLSRVISVDTTNGNVTGANATLRAGDANDDNIVDINDLAALIQAFDAEPGSANWNNGQADFDCNELVEVHDLSLLIQNFDKEGDP